MNKPYAFDCLPVHPAPEALESFTGYMIRLAELNRIRSVSALRIVLFNDPGFRPHLRLAHTDNVWRPFERFATAACCSVEQLRATTTYHLVTKFDCPMAHPFLQNSLAASLRYCPDCLREHNYYRLDWRFLTLPGCARHGKYLLDRCGQCGQAIALLNACLRISVCPHCQADLRSCVAPSLTEDAHRLTQLRTPDLAYLLAPQSWEMNALAIRTRAGAWLSYQRQEQQLSSIQLARQLGVPQPYLRRIELPQARREGLRFPCYLAYTDALKTSWSATFAYVSQHPELPMRAAQLRAQHLLQRIEQALDQMEQSGQPISKNAVGRAVGLSPECFNLYPDIRQLMVNLPERSRQQRERQWLKAAQTVVADLQRQQQPITLRGIYQRIPRFPRNLTSYPQLHHFLAQYFSEACLTPKSQPTHPQEALLLERLAVLTDDLAAQDQPVTLPQLTKALGITPATVYAYPVLRVRLAEVRQYCKQVQRQRVEDQLVQQAQAIIHEQTTRGQRSSIISVCRALGKPFLVLAKYPRLYALFQQVKSPRGRRPRRSNDLA